MNLESGDVFQVNQEEPATDAYPLALSGEYLLWAKREGKGYARSNFSLWITNLVTTEVRLIAEQTRVGDISGNLVVYPRNGDIYGLYLPD